MTLFHFNMVCKYRTFFERKNILKKKNFSFFQKSHFKPQKWSEKAHIIRFKPSHASVGDFDFTPPVGGIQDTDFGAFV